MVTSGNSWRSRVSTSPIDEVASRVLTGVRPSLARRQVDELELADLDLVARGKDASSIRSRFT